MPGLKRYRLVSRKKALGFTSLLCVFVKSSFVWNFEKSTCCEVACYLAYLLFFSRCLEPILFLLGVFDPYTCCLMLDHRLRYLFACSVSSFAFLPIDGSHIIHGIRPGK